MDLCRCGIVGIGDRISDGECAEYKSSVDKSRTNVEIGVAK
jgi:hypothetical protein